MLSVFDIFKIGIEPSSSHTVGPMRIATRFLEEAVDAGVLSETVRVIISLHGSLALTGAGHGPSFEARGLRRSHLRMRALFAVSSAGECCNLSTDSTLILRRLREAKASKDGRQAKVFAPMHVERAPDQG